MLKMQFQQLILPSAWLMHQPKLSFGLGDTLTRYPYPRNEGEEHE
jgi:ADP-dependent phosphofructokinase/glucokinase